MKLSSLRFSMILLLAGLRPVIGAAVPVKYPACASSKKINAVPGSNGAFFNEDCSELYILPPQVSGMHFSDYRPAGNLDVQCDRLRLIEQDEAKNQEIATVNTERLLDLTKQVQALEANLQQGLLPVGQSADDVQNRIDKLTDKVDALRTKMYNWQTQDDDRKLKFSQVEGGRGAFVIQSTYAALVQEFARANPGLVVKPMAIDQGFVSINEEKASSSTAASMPAVLRLSLSGVGEVPLLRDPNILLVHKDLAPYKAPAGSQIFDGGLAGSLLLSNIGACAVRGALGGRATFDAKDLKAYVSASATYSYQVQVTRKHSLTFKMRELVRQMHEEVKRGGFFSHSTINNQIDARQTTSWIEFHASSEDTRFDYTDDYIRDVKKEFIDRALAQVISIQTGSPAALLTLIDASGKNGADVAGDLLGKCPDAHCQIGAAGFKVLSAIFGSESATANLLKTLDADMSEVVDIKRMVPAYGTYAFE